MANHVSSVKPAKRAMRAEWCGQLEDSGIRVPSKIMNALGYNGTFD